LFEAQINGQQVTVQVERSGSGYKLFYRGAEINALVLSPKAAALNKLMLEKAPADLSKFLLSPMPGLLVKLGVKVGDQVKAGEELAVVEAMKMENSLRAINDGIVAKISAKAGDSLMVDQAILEFE
jgi:propionyl-CoA carboxylase alpha chain